MRDTRSRDVLRVALGAVPVIWVFIYAFFLMPAQSPTGHDLTTVRALARASSTGLIIAYAVVIVFIWRGGGSR